MTYQCMHYSLCQENVQIQKSYSRIIFSEPIEKLRGVPFSLVGDVTLESLCSFWESRDEKSMYLYVLSTECRMKAQHKVM